MGGETSLMIGCLREWRRHHRGLTYNQSNYFKIKIMVVNSSIVEMPYDKHTTRGRLMRRKTSGTSRHTRKEHTHLNIIH